MKSKLFYLLLILGLSTSCATRNLVYFSDIESGSDFSVKVSNTIEPVIQTDDLLKVTVSSLNPESNLLFNAGVLNTSGTGGNVALSPLNDGYLVDNNGEINFPVLGLVKLGGLNKEQAIEEMAFRLREYVKDPIVNIRFLNFKVTVIGEVNNPSTFTVPTEKINILEALGLAGDMTAYGKRENVLIIREKEGVRSATRLNLNDRSVLNSPYYYLTQNDVVYVEPDKMKAVQVAVNPNRNQLIAISSSILVALIIQARFLFD
jgi:polysaccharide export outer membrane protein